MYNTKRRGALDFTYQLKMTIEENNNLTKSVEELSKELFLLRRDYDLINSRLINYEEKNKKLKIFFKKYNVLDLNELTDIIVKYKNNKCYCIPVKDTHEYKELQKQIQNLELNEKKQTQLESQNISLKNEIDNLNYELNNSNKKFNVEKRDEIKESIKQEYDIHIKNITEEHNKILTEIQKENIELKLKLNEKMKDKDILPTPPESPENKEKKLERNIKGKINTVIDKIIRNNKLIRDEEDRLKLITENRCKIDTLSFFNEKYGNNNNDNIKLLCISYDKNPSRF
jgi:hypothetical protein